jgi:restriction system protein
VVGIPNPEAYHSRFVWLDEVTASAKADRPTSPDALDYRFQAYRFPTHLFDLNRPHPGSLSDTEPRKVTLTAEDIVMRPGIDMKAFYARAGAGCEFPCEPPGYSTDEPQRAKPKFPNVQVPPQLAVKLVTRNGVEVDWHDPFMAKAYRTEFERVGSLNSQAALLHQTFLQKYKLAKEAQELMEIYLGDLTQKCRALLEDFERVKGTYEQECRKATAPIRAVQQELLARTCDGVRFHFELTLCTLSLSVPSDYQWQVLYDQSDRILQVNQCVPSLSDVTVVRTDSKRPPAKRDAEAVLRRFVPAIALQLAHHVARNDLQDDIDKIAVNCWSRFFEPSSGRLKDAFVASLVVAKAEIAQVNLERADALEAFRALRGSFVFNVQEVVPIEPTIRLDKEDSRFVAGREVLDGMAQGQNLGAMDWQDFEHLIRELLAKEYADKNAEVKITRASRDRGVDAVVFNSDPLHGGKFVVQAKRYSNTVDVAAVRELYGTVLNEGANRGILVTTSHFGRDAYEWASNKHPYSDRWSKPSRAADQARLQL